MNIGFVVREAAAGLRRNTGLAVAMVLTTAVALLMLGSGVLVWRMADATEQRMLDATEVRVFLTEAVSESDPGCEQPLCREAKSALEGVEGIREVRHLDRAEALDLFRRLYENSELARNVSNDAAFPGMFLVRFDDAARAADGLVDAVRAFNERAGVPVLEKPLDSRDAVRATFGLLGGIRDAAFVLAAIQMLAAVLLIGTMVQMAARSRSDELTIMRLVGARGWAIRMPFVLEVTAASVVGASVAAAGLFGVNSAFRAGLSSQAHGDELAPLAQVSMLDAGQVWPVAGAVVAIGFIVAAVTSWVAVRITVRR